jgi:hypothetical protein
LLNPGKLRREIQRIANRAPRGAVHRCASVCIGGSITLRGFVAWRGDERQWNHRFTPMHTDGDGEATVT